MNVYWLNGFLDKYAGTRFDAYSIAPPPAVWGRRSIVISMRSDDCLLIWPIQTGPQVYSTWLRIMDVEGYTYSVIELQPISWCTNWTWLSWRLLSRWFVGLRSLFSSDVIHSWASDKKHRHVEYWSSVWLSLCIPILIDRLYQSKDLEGNCTVYCGLFCCIFKRCLLKPKRLVYSNAKKFPFSQKYKLTNNACAYTCR